MSWASVVSNSIAVIQGAGFVRADPRYPIDKAPIGGADRHFQVEEANLFEAMHWGALPQHRKRSTLLVRVAYFRGGGNAGGETYGGDRMNVNARAVSDLLSLAQRLTSPLRYDAQNSKINRVIDPDIRRVVDEERHEVWELGLTVEYEETPSVRAA